MQEIHALMLPNTTSYGITAYSIIYELNKRGIKVNLFPINIQGIEVTSQEDHSLIQKCIDNCAEFGATCPSVKLWHAFDIAGRIGKGKSYGWPIFELDTFSPREISHLRSHDELIVCSRWGKQVCINNNLDMPIHVVPLGVNREIFHERYSKNNFPRKYPESTVFINVGKIELRKHDILLKCFEKAFDNNENVELHMVWKNRLLDQRKPEEAKTWEKYYKSSKLSHRITLHEWYPDQVDVAKLICGADCGVFPSHAEGFNFGLLQCLSAGLRVICTNYSAHTEYATSENSMLIQTDKLEPAFDGVWFNGDGNWCVLGKDQEEQLIQHMRSVHEKKSYYNGPGVATAKKLTWSNTVDKLIEAIQ